ncbi:hypothetical protein HHK36_015800 [Tetracentron sinense]|uniref:Uncharacterized protein n=1 Tax=Tetracentron sinense TaxID=13715 RepID=A0A834Z2W4_TETSI|nr:hypothetical protein HHK36_015800 [Tetracentron sinense]
MECEGKEEHEMRSRSFRYEDYNNRRVFLRSYPLHWGEEGEGQGEGEEEKEDKVSTVSKGGEGKKSVKKIFLSVFHWGGGKVLVLRKFKHKIAFYLVACHPFGFKPPTVFISA